jgi:uncharacterized protein (DUF2147 family)
MRRLFLTNILLALFLVGHAQKNEDLIIGKWYTSNSDAIIEMYYGISEEEAIKKVFGKIVWLEEPTDEYGEFKVDKENPDIELRKNKILGLRIISDLEREEDDEFIWEDGEAYDPETGNVYNFKAYIDPDEPNILNCRGYIGFSLLGRTEVWKRKMD